MIENIKKLRKLLKLQKEGEAQIKFDGFSVKELDKAIKERQEEVVKNINSLGWLLVFLIIIPLALIQLGMSSGASAFASYIFAFIIYSIIHKITGKSY